MSYVGSLLLFVKLSQNNIKHWTWLCDKQKPLTKVIKSMCSKNCFIADILSLTLILSLILPLPVSFFLVLIVSLILILTLPHAMSSSFSFSHSFSLSFSFSFSPSLSKNKVAKHICYLIQFLPYKPSIYSFLISDFFSSYWKKNFSLYSKIYKKILTFLNLILVAEVCLPQNFTFSAFINSLIYFFQLFLLSISFYRILVFLHFLVQHWHLWTREGSFKFDAK